MENVRDTVQDGGYTRGLTILHERLYEWSPSSTMDTQRRHRTRGGHTCGELHGPR